jgi:hypothetical protein
MNCSKLVYSGIRSKAPTNSVQMSYLWILYDVSIESYDDVKILAFSRQESSEKSWRKTFSKKNIFYHAKMIFGF